MKVKTELTYAERAAKLARQARRNAVLAGERLYARCRRLRTLTDVKSINLLRAAGDKFNEASGRNQLLFNLAGLEFCRKEILPLLKTGMTLKQVAMCCHVANRVPAPITEAELPAVKAELQLSLRVMGLLDEAHHEGQSLIERNLFCTLATKARQLVLTWDDLEKESPMAAWDVAELDEFLATVAPVREKIAAAERLRQTKTVALGV